MKKTISTLLGVIALLLMVAAPAALAAQAQDGGADEAWDNTMNQTSYWESRFGSDTRNVTCTKYEGHGGHIPAKYDAAVIKDGNMVRVYADLTESGAINAVGAINPANGKRFEAPHSWVMKCEFEDVEQPVEDPKVRLTFFCVATQDGPIQNIADFGLTSPDFTDGEYVFRVREEAGVATGYTVKIGGTEYASGSIGANETTFITLPQGAGYSIVTDTGTNLWNGTASTNETGCDYPEEPEPQYRERVEESEWVDGEFECDDTTVTQTRTVTTYTEVSTDGGETWQPDGATAVKETRTRDLTDEEFTECPDPDPTPTPEPTPDPTPTDTPDPDPEPSEPTVVTPDEPVEDEEQTLEDVGIADTGPAGVAGLIALGLTMIGGGVAAVRRSTWT